MYKKIVHHDVEKVNKSRFLSDLYNIILWDVLIGTAFFII